MDWSLSREMLFALFISTPLTNVARQNDSDPNSRANLELQEVMQTTGGWSPQYPMAAVSMKNWPVEFVKSKNPEGCTAEEYIKKEMERRAKAWEDYKKAALDPKNKELCDAFEDLFCEPVMVPNPAYTALITERDTAIAALKPKKGQTLEELTANVHAEFKDRIDATPETVEASPRTLKLIDLTVDNAYWVHSGHQRTEFVFLNAYALHLKRRKTNGFVDDGQGEGQDADKQHAVGKFRTLVPVTIGTYENYLDILKDQLGVNAGATKQNTLTIFDYVKAAVACIGDGIVMKMKEREFRDMCAETTIGGTKKGNPGAAPRRAHLIAQINWYYEGRLKLVEKLNALPKKEIGGEQTWNPDYIDINELQLGHLDPKCDVSVMARVMEPSLQKLKDYRKNYGDLNQAVIDKKKEDAMSAFEYEIITRGPKHEGQALTEEEALAWVASRCKGAPHGIRQEPMQAETVKKFDPDTLKQIAQSPSAPEYMRDFLALKLNVRKAADKEILPEAEDRLLKLKGPMDGIYHLNLEDATDKLLVDTLNEVFRVKDGNNAAYQAVIPQFQAVLAAELAKPATVIETTATKVEGEPAAEQKQNANTPAE